MLNLIFYILRIVLGTDLIHTLVILEASPKGAAPFFYQIATVFPKPLYFLGQIFYNIVNESSKGELP